MEKTRTILQRIERTFPTPIEVATKYYTLLFVTSSLALTTREIQLLAFTATRGSISGIARQQFISLYNSSKGTVANMVHHLKEKGMLVRENNKIRVHPKLALDFSKDLVLVISLKNQHENHSKKEPQLSEATIS